MPETPSHDWESAAGHIIRMLRESRGLTSDELGQAIGVTAGHIRHIERGERRPRLDHCQAIASHLGVPVARIVGEEVAALIAPLPAQAS
jgi:transcriptional regulator with XRE-family HTH domain